MASREQEGLSATVPPGVVDPLAHLLDLRQLDTRRIVGLMSGTSGDGIDAAVVEVAAGAADQAGLLQTKLLAFCTLPLDRDLKQRLMDLPRSSSAELCDVNFLLGEALARATLEVAARGNLELDRLHLVGSHGHTARHHPRGAQFGVGATLQIGEAAVVAEMTGLPVVSDFRVADVAAGGQGAPLMPTVDQLLFHNPSAVRVMLNLGGIANITVLDPDPERIVAFDTGPANMPLDAVARAASKGAMGFDRDGALAATGTVDTGLLADLMDMDYIRQGPPKSTGHELFGRDFTAGFLERYSGRLADLAATMVQFTAETIAGAIDRFVTPQHGRVSELLVSGGGVHNSCLMERIARRMHPVPVASVAQVGMNPDAKEAIGFAVLANQTLFSRPTNIPQATGARGPRVLGKLTLPSS